MLNEKVYISNTLKGDMESFSILVQLYQKQLYNFINKFIGNKEDAEDILQEVFVKAFNNLYKFDYTYSFATWIYKIALNTCKSAYKKKKQKPISCTIDDFVNEIYSMDHCPERILEVKEYSSQIISMFDSLNESQKTALLLRYYKDFSYKEIAQIMDISTEAAKMKVQRAKTTLGDRFQILKNKGVWP